MGQGIMPNIVRQSAGISFLKLSGTLFDIHCGNINCVHKLDVYVGSIDIATSEVNGRQMTDRWFSFTTPSTSVRKDSRSTTSSPAVIRIKVHFRSIKILPVSLYRPLIEVCRPERMMWHCSHTVGRFCIAYMKYYCILLLLYLNILCTSSL